MSTGNGHFNLLARVLHWSMALMIVAMLFIGVTMVASAALAADADRPAPPIGHHYRRTGVAAPVQPAASSPTAAARIFLCGR